MVEGVLPNTGLKVLTVVEGVLPNTGLKVLTVVEGVLPNTGLKVLTPHVVIFLDGAFGR